MKLIALVAAAALCSAPAFAADLRISPSPAAGLPSYLWDGFYIGANAGAGVFQSTTDDVDGLINGGFPLTLNGSGIGGLVGGTAGYNVQFGQAVLGVEGDLQWSSLNADSSWGPEGGYVNDPRWNWFGTLRVRGGVAFDRGLVYATAGAVAADAHYHYGFADDTPGYVADSTDVEWGLAAGAGVEYALDDHWSAKLEYLDLMLPTKRVGSDPLEPPGEVNFSSGTQIARVGINYHF